MTNRTRELRIKYFGLEMSGVAKQLMYHEPEKFSACCNGVGSQSGWLGKLTYHIIPNTIWLMSITPASDIHDVEYTYPMEFETEADALEWKREADNRFYNNVLTLIERRGGWFEAPRRLRAATYYRTLRMAGMESFLASKTILEDNNDAS